MWSMGNHPEPQEEVNTVRTRAGFQPTMALGLLGVVLASANPSTMAMSEQGPRARLDGLSLEPIKDAARAHQCLVRRGRSPHRSVRRSHR